MVDFGGGLVGKDSAILESGVHYHRMLVKSGRCATVGTGGEKPGGGA